MASTPHLVVIGSANQDVVVRVEHIPAPGETVLGGAFVTPAGGKGANQAVAAARLGAYVQFVGRVGADAFGDSLRREMSEAGVDVGRLLRDPEHPTGVALIGVADSGQNAIIVAPGANGRVSPADVDEARPLIAAADAVVLQLEIPLKTVAHAVNVAHELGTRVILNPAPVSHVEPLPADLLQRVGVLTPNEHEAANLLGLPSASGLSMDDAARRLRALGPAIVIITLGSDGCLIATEAETLHIPAVAVTPVDTTAAGDCFTGALAVALAEGLPIDAAARFAIRAASLSVTRMGAQPSLPLRQELDAFR